MQNKSDTDEDRLNENEPMLGNDSMFYNKWFYVGVVGTLIMFLIVGWHAYAVAEKARIDKIHSSRILAAVINQPRQNNSEEKAKNFKESLKLPQIWEPLRNSIELKTLDNGIEILLIKDPKAKSTNACFSMDAGSYHETLMQTGKNKISHGTAHQTEHSMFLGISPDQKSILSAWNAQTHSMNTYYMQQSSNANFLDALQLYYKELANFTRRADIQDETNAVNNEYLIDVKLLTWTIELTEQKIAVNNKNPASWFSIGNHKTLRHEGIQDEVFNFYKEFYTTKKMNVVVIGNSDDNGSIDKFMESIESVMNKPRNSLSDKPQTKEVTYDVPLYEKVPSMLFIGQKGVSMLKFSFGLKIKGVSRFDFENHANFVADYLNKQVQQQISVENYYGYNQDMGVETMDNLQAKMEVNFAQTNYGKKNITNIIRIVDHCIKMAKKYLLTSENKKTYQDTTNTKFLLSQTSNLFVYSQFLSQNIAHYGAENAFSGRYGLIENMNDSIINKIFDQLTSEKMLVTYIDDFHKESSLKEQTDQNLASKKLFKAYDLTQKLDKKIQSKELKFDKESKKELKDNKNDKIVLDQYLIDYNVFYHFQEFDSNFMKNFKIRLLELPPKVEQNPFLPKKAELDYIKGFQKSFETKDNNLVKIFEDSNNFWYKQVNHFQTPVVAVTLTFDLNTYVTDLEKKIKIKLKKYERQAFNRILAKFWILRLDSLNINLSEINASRIVAFTQGKIKIMLTMPEYSFEKVLNVIIQKINVTGQDVQKDKVSLLQFTEAENSTAKEVKYPILKSLDQKHRYSCFILKSCNCEDKHLKFLQSKKYEQIKFYFEKPRQIFGLVIGSIKLDKIKESMTKVKNDFSIVKEELKERKLINFEGEYLPVFRKVNQQGDTGKGNVFYSSAFEIDKIDPENIGTGKFLSLFLHNEAFTYLRQKKQLGYNVHVSSRILANKLLIELTIIGQDIQKIEEESEKFFGQVEEKIKNLDQKKVDMLVKTISSLYLDDWKSIADEVKFYGDLLWNAKQIILNHDLKKEIPEALAKLTAKKVYDYYTNVFKNSKRIVFEYLPKKLDGTKIDKKNSFENKEVKFYQ